jgi:dTDP-4-dehydrorhamnose 3,5-epimerase-like enzyme
MSNLISWVSLPVLGDDRGALVAIEENATVPFEIKRVYYIYNTLEGVSRGFHAHHELDQVVICLSGSCKMLMDDGIAKETVDLCRDGRGLMLPRMVWHEMHDFSEDCILLVLASDLYDESDYIRNYDDFYKAVTK